MVRVLRKREGRNEPWTRIHNVVVSASLKHVDYIVDQ